MTGAIDLTGRKFGELTVVSQMGKSISGHTLWKVACSCGVLKTVERPNLIRAESCGCARNKRAAVRHRTHGLGKTRQFRIWAGLVQRCTNEKSVSWINYGGRGITVDESWLSSFASFWKDMGSSYADGLSIDRINNDLGYFKENCRWVDRKTQNRNTRRNVRIETVDGSMTISEIAERHGLPFLTVWKRLRRGWPVGLLSSPSGTRLRNVR